MCKFKILKTSATVLGIAQPQTEHEELTDDSETNMFLWNNQKLNCMLGKQNCGKILSSCCLDIESLESLKNDTEKTNTTKTTSS